jgi:ribosomal-protein-alanine N-acetyltransferase
VNPPTDPGFALRPLRWWDIDAVLPIERALFGAGAWSPETFWSELAQTATRWYVVAQDGAGPDGAGPDGEGRLLGYAGLSVTGAEADVHTLAVAGSAQRRGVGTALLRALVDEAAARGARSLVLEVRAGNQAAIELYRRHGFERIAVRRGYYQPEGEDAWIMRLRPIVGPVAGAGPSL